MAPRGATVVDAHDIEVCLDYVPSGSRGRKAFVMKEVKPEGSPSKANKRRKVNPPNTPLPTSTPTGPSSQMRSTPEAPAPVGFQDNTDHAFCDSQVCGDGDPEPAYHESIMDPPTGKKSDSKTTHEYMEEWAQRHCETYLAAMLEAEGRRTLACELCGSGRVEIRCLDCICVPRLCRECCRTSHRLTPLHRIETWVGNRWQPAWLWHVGTVVCLGHGSSPCPYYKKARGSLEEMVIRLASLDAKTMKRFPNDPTFGARPEKGELGGGLMMTLVHTNGFHKLPVFPCFCPNSPAIHIQLLKSGLYPSTSAETQTVFTLHLLKHFHLSTVDSNLSVEHYCELLQRLTNFTFPSETLDRRRELTRVWQQYGHLIDLKRNGFGVTSIQIETPQKGELALFCAVCPQPGVNLPENWRELGDQWRFWRYITADGNFVLDHLEILGADTAVWLSNGAHYFAETTRFGRFLDAVTEKTEAPTCNQLRAISDKNKTRKGYDSTGIVACACTRHGCFCPGSVVDMQKGEKQANADYSISQACETTKVIDTLGLMLAYDINCQYWVHFRKRFQNAFLRGSIPPEAAILFLIGLFHVHGHKEECLPRFAPTFAPGAGMAAAEILESLWADLIGAANMTRNMTVAHRIAVLNACMADSNWKKFLGTVNWLNKQFRLAKTGLAAAEKDFERLNGTQMCSDQQREEWEILMEEAHESRLAGDVEAMDVYKTTPFEAEGQNEVQIRLMHDELATESRRGVAEWLASGIRIQEEQLELRAYVKAKGSDRKAGAAQIEAERKRASLLNKVEEFFEKGVDLFDGLDLEGIAVTEVVERNLCICEDPLNFCNCDNESTEPAPPEGRGGARGRNKKGSKAKKRNGKIDVEVERMTIPLPSTSLQRPTRWDSEASKEEELRVAQAHEALEALRGHIAHKSYLYRTNKKLANGKRGRKSRYGQINSVESALRLEAKKYDLARWALIRLNVIEKYPELEELTSRDTRAVISVWDPNAEGQRNAELPWIWKVRSSADAKDADEYVQDLYRVNWIRAKSRRDRWKEEMIMLESEMEWVTVPMRIDKADMWARQGRFAKAKFAKMSGIVVDVKLGDEGDETDGLETVEDMEARNEGEMGEEACLGDRWNEDHRNEDGCPESGVEDGGAEGDSDSEFDE